jgi:hypothetical protein
MSTRAQMRRAFGEISRRLLLREATQSYDKSASETLKMLQIPPDDLEPAEFAGPRPDHKYYMPIMSRPRELFPEYFTGGPANVYGIEIFVERGVVYYSDPEFERFCLACSPYFRRTEKYLHRTIYFYRQRLWKPPQPLSERREEIFRLLRNTIPLPIAREIIRQVESPPYPQTVALLRRRRPPPRELAFDPIEYAAATANWTNTVLIGKKSAREELYVFAPKPPK